MSAQLVVNVLIGTALVGFLAFRQATWQYLDPARIWRTPIVMGVVGLVVLANSGVTVTTTDVVLLAVEALVTIVVGLTMGRITRFRTVSTPDDKGRTVQARTGWTGAALWLVLIAVRIGLDVLGGHLGAHLLTSTGTVLLVLALNRAARAVVVDQRVPRGGGARRPDGMMVR